MGKAWKRRLIASVLTAVLWAAGAHAAEEGQPKTFNSQVAFGVYAVTGDRRESVGRTPSEAPLTVPPCDYLLIEPHYPVDMEKVRQEIVAQGIPGLKLSAATDADLEHLKGLAALQELDLAGTQVTDAGLEHLKGLTALQRLNLRHTKVTDAGLAHLGGLTALQVLDLAGTHIIGAGLKHLEGLKGLEDLRLCDTKVTDAGLAGPKGLTALDRLDLSETQVTDAGLADLNGLSQLRFVDLSHTGVTEAGVRGLMKSRPDLKVIGPAGIEP